MPNAIEISPKDRRTAESIETIATQTEENGKLRNDGFDCFGMDDGARF